MQSFVNPLPNITRGSTQNVFRNFCILYDFDTVATNFINIIFWVRSKTIFHSILSPTKSVFKLLQFDCSDSHENENYCRWKNYRISHLYYLMSTIVYEMDGW